MTNANMKLVMLDVSLDGEMETPEQNLEDGETITRRAVEVAKLYSVLKGTRHLPTTRD
jgi:ADP-ribose pyrophosphatase